MDDTDIIISFSPWIGYQPFLISFTLRLYSLSPFLSQIYFFFSFFPSIVLFKWIPSRFIVFVFHGSVLGSNIGRSVEKKLQTQYGGHAICQNRGKVPSRSRDASYGQTHNELGSLQCCKHNQAVHQDDKHDRTAIRTPVVVHEGKSAAYPLTVDITHELPSVFEDLCMAGVYA